MKKRLRTGRLSAPLSSFFVLMTGALFTAGALAGAWLGGELYQSLDLHWLPALIGVLILLFTWVPLPRLHGGGQLSLALLGF